MCLCAEKDSKQIISSFLFFPLRKERSLNSASLFRTARALCGSLHRCTFCKGPEGRQGRLRGRCRDRRRGHSGSRLPAQQRRRTAEPAAELSAEEERVWGSGPEQVRPQTGPDPCETRAPSSRGVGGRGRNRQPQLLEDGLTPWTCSVMAVLPPAVDYLGFPKWRMINWEVERTGKCKDLFIWALSFDSLFLWREVLLNKRV